MLLLPLLAIACAPGAGPSDTAGGDDTAAPALTMAACGAWAAFAPDQVRTYSYSDATGDAGTEIDTVQGFDGTTGAFDYDRDLNFTYYGGGATGEDHAVRGSACADDGWDVVSETVYDGATAGDPTTFDPALLWLPAALDQSTGWSSTTTASSTANPGGAPLAYTYTVMDGGEIATEQGTYDTLLVERTSDNGGVLDTYYAEDVGAVRSSNSQGETWVLVSVQ